MIRAPPLLPRSPGISEQNIFSRNFQKVHNSMHICFNTPLKVLNKTRQNETEKKFLDLEMTFQAPAAEWLICTTGKTEQHKTRESTGAYTVTVSIGIEVLSGFTSECCTCIRCNSR